MKGLDLTGIGGTGNETQWMILEDNPQTENKQADPVDYQVRKTKTVICSFGNI
jgi:hypothetical protein